MILVLAKLMAMFNVYLGVLLFMRRRQQGSPFQFFYLMLVSVVLWPDIFQPTDLVVDFHPLGNIFFYSTNDYIKTQIISFLYLICFLVFESVIPSKPTPLKFNTHDHNNFLVFLPIAILIGVVALLVQRNGLAALSNVSFSDLRDGPVSLSYLLISYLSIFCLFLPAYLFHGQKKYVLGIGIFLLFIAIYLIIGGTRQTTIISGFVFALFFIEKGKRPSLFLILLFTVGFTFIEFALAFAKLLRNTGGFEQRLVVLTAALNGSVDLSGTSSDGSIRQVYHYFLVSEGSAAFGEFKYMIRSLLFWLPSFLDFSSIKPSDFEYDMFAYAMGGREGTMHATYFGSTFADSGYLFPIWCLFTVTIFRTIEFFIRAGNNSWFLWCLSVYVAVMAARGSLYAVLVVISIGILLSILNSMLRRILLDSRRNKPPLVRTN